MHRSGLWSVTTTTACSFFVFVCRVRFLGGGKKLSLFSTLANHSVGRKELRSAVVVSLLRESFSLSLSAALRGAPEGGRKRGRGGAWGGPWL